MLEENALFENLKELDQFLELKNKRMVLHLIGGISLLLHKIDIGRVTVDIDSVTMISALQVSHYLKTIKKDLFL